jgi:hypothetical protein
LSRSNCKSQFEGTRVRFGILENITYSITESCTGEVLTFLPCLPRPPFSPGGPGGPTGPTSPFVPRGPVYHRTSTSIYQLHGISSFFLSFSVPHSGIPVSHFFSFMFVVFCLTLRSLSFFFTFYYFVNDTSIYLITKIYFIL